ncbi:hypothetical protein MHPYR_800008 [uncultured Mycobacterium sp.]|uniref:Uncharacterized protein n=1 Tax=uncultured Mycobacterium sp. TaxID=171292 RepID=A0A1Y5PLQ3_9MYCO|nr:hypothetical protein MHPYR_800008 [uncultured Mycobacterium sp.]
MRGASGAINPSAATTPYASLDRREGMCRLFFNRTGSLPHPVNPRSDKDGSCRSRRNPQCHNVSASAWCGVTAEGGVVFSRAQRMFSRSRAR